MTLDVAKLRPETLAALEVAGWTRSRRTSPWRWLGVLMAEGYSDFPAARDVLAELGGLTLQSGPMIGPNFPNAEIIFDPVLAGSGDRDHAELVEETIGGPVFPIGEWRTGMLTLIAEDGAVYAIGGYGLWRASATVEGFLNLVVCVDESVEILHGPWWPDR